MLSDGHPACLLVGGSHVSRMFFQKRWLVAVLRAGGVAVGLYSGHQYVDETLKVMAIPQNWIVDSTGVVHLKGEGYDRTEKWESGMKEAIEKYK